MKKVNGFMITSVVFTSLIAFIYLLDFFIGFLVNPYFFVADMMIISLLLMILGIGFFYKNEMLNGSSITLIIVIGVELLLTRYYTMDDTLIILFSWIEILLLISVVFAILFQVKKNINVLKRQDAFEALTKTVYLTYDIRTNMITLDFSDDFMKEYHLNKKELVLDIETFTSFLHEDDQEKVSTVLNYFDHMDTDFETIAKYKFPGLDDYVSFSIRLSKPNRYQIKGIQVDITDVKNLESLLQKKNIEIEQIEQEYQTIMTHTSEMILRINKDGIILFATDAFKALFDKKTVIGANIIDLNTVLTGKRSTNWLEKIKTQHRLTGISEFLVGGERKYFYWQNDAVLDNKNELDYIISIGRDVTDIQKLNQRLEFSTTHDEQTGLYNKQGLYQLYEQYLKDKSLTFFFLEIRDFVMLNEFYGNETGVEILKILGDRLKSFTKQFGSVIHLNGEKFLVVVDKEAMNPNELIKRLNDKLSKTFYTNNAKISVVIDTGYVHYPEESKQLNQIITYAALAKEHARKQNDGRIYAFNQTMSALANEQFELSNKIKSAIDHESIDIAFQGIFEATTGKIKHVEALMRFEYHGEVVNPEKILQLAKDKGLSLRLDRYLISQALKQFKRLKNDSKYQDAILNINLAPQSLIDDGFSEFMIAQIKRYDYSVNEVCLEITENSFVDYNERIFNQMSVLKSSGFMIALDDFGKEYSSLSVLSEFNFDIVKIDKTFVQLLDNEVNTAIITMIEKIAKLRDSTIIAEGVETKAQSDALLKLSCTYQQGYYFMRPEIIKS